MSNGNVFQRWQSRVEKGLLRLIEMPLPPEKSGRYRETLERSRNLLKLKAPMSRLFNSLGELSLRLGFQILSIVLLRRAENIDPKDPLPKINLSRAQLSLANRFFLRAPKSGAVSYNLQNGNKRLDQLIQRRTLPESKLVEVTLLRRRIEDRLEMWKDVRRGELEPGEIKEILLKEDEQLRQVQIRKIPSVAELEKLEPRRVGFYYREYREEQLKRKEKRHRK
ncbi:MAG TPA: hypothetical protein VM123_08435 [archaeon]|nr:hypothetical protein [archaeon]